MMNAKNSVIHVQLGYEGETICGLPIGFGTIAVDENEWLDATCPDCTA